MLGYLTTLPSFIHELVRAAVNSLGNRVPPQGKELWGTKLRFFRIAVQRHSDVAYGADSVYAAFSVSPPAKWSRRSTASASARSSTSRQQTLTVSSSSSSSSSFS